MDKSISSLCFKDRELFRVQYQPEGNLGAENELVDILHLFEQHINLVKKLVIGNGFSIQRTSQR